MSSHWMMEHGLWLTLHKHQELSRLGFVLQSWVVSSHIIAYQYSVRLSGQPSVDPWSSISVQLLYLYAILCLKMFNPLAFPQLWSQLSENAVGLSGFFLNCSQAAIFGYNRGFHWIHLAYFTFSKESQLVHYSIYFVHFSRCLRWGDYLL